MAAKIQELREAIVRNDNPDPIEILIPADERVRVHYGRDRFSYEVNSPRGAQESVVLQPGEWLEQL